MRSSCLCPRVTGIARAGLNIMPIYIYSYAYSILYAPRRRLPPCWCSRYNFGENCDGAGIRLGGHVIDGFVYGVDNHVSFCPLYVCLSYKAQLSPVPKRFWVRACQRWPLLYPSRCSSSMVRGWSLWLAMLPGGT